MNLMLTLSYIFLSDQSHITLQVEVVLIYINFPVWCRIKNYTSSFPPRMSKEATNELSYGVF